MGCIHIIAGLIVVLAASSSVAEATCVNATCSRFFNAQCDDNHCDKPPCPPHFFFRGRNVTDRCDIETCKEKKCNENRRCMEELRTVECEGDQSSCRQYIKARCVSLLPPRPTKCSDIQCTSDEICRFRERENRRPVVRCVQLSKQTSCTHHQCEPGFTCVENKPNISCEKIATEQPTETSTTQSTTTTDVGPSTTEPTDACSDFQCPVEQSCVLEFQCVQTSIGNGSGSLGISLGSGSVLGNTFGSGSGSGLGTTCKDFVCPHGSECKLQPICSPATSEVKLG